MKKINFIKKTVAFVANFSLLLNSFLPLIITARPVFAEDEIKEVLEATPTPENIPTIIEVTPTEEPTVTPEITPEITVAPEATSTPTLTPTETITPTPEVQNLDNSYNPSSNDSSNVSNNNPSPVNTPTIAVTITPTEPPKVLGQTTSGEIDTNIVPNNQSRTDLLNPSLFTDKADYHPTEIAIISGQGFMPNSQYFLNITSEDLNITYPIESDETGSFTYSYQLDGTYRPDYRVEAKDTTGRVISTISFTDSNNNPSLDISGAGNGNGKIKSNDGNIDCTITNGNKSGKCFYLYTGNFTTTLTATTLNGSIFNGWSGDCSGNGTCEASENGNKTFNVTATFNLPSDTTPPTITDFSISNPTNWGDSYNIYNLPNHKSIISGLPTVGGTINIGANFADDQILTNIIAYLPGRGFFTDSEFSPTPINNATWLPVSQGKYQVSWNTLHGSDWRTVVDGNYDFIFEARDKGTGQNGIQNSTTKTLSLTVDNTAPNLEFTSPTPDEDSVVKGTINVSANFNDVNGLMNTMIGIHAVQWFCNTSWPTMVLIAAPSILQNYPMGLKS